MVRPSTDRLALLHKMLTEHGIDSSADQTIKRRPEEIDAPLSSAQQRLWFLEQFDPGTSLYNDALTVRIRSDHFDVDVFRRAFEVVVARHESLRTSFILEGTRPVQHVDEKVRIPFRLEDIRHYPDVRGTMEEIIVDDVREPFLLDEAPLFNAILFRLDDDEWVFSLTMHHIISDAVSYGIIYSEISVAYESLLQGKSPVLEPLPLQFADYATWESSALKETDFGDKIAYWKNYLGGTLPAMDWPVRNVEPANAGSFLRFEFPLSLHKAIEDFSRSAQLTSNQVLLACYFALLHTLGDNKDLRVGVPSSARNRSELQNLVGFFVRTVILRLELSPEMSFQDLVTRLRETSLDVSQYEDVPFEQVVQALRSEQPSGTAPLIQAWFAHMKGLVKAPQIAGAETTYEIVDAKNARFELSLILDESDSGISGIFEYDVELFSAEMVSELIDRFKAIVQQVVGRPAVTLKELRANLGDLAEPSTVPSVLRETATGTYGSGRKKLSLTKTHAFAPAPSNVASTSTGATSSGQEDWVDVEPLLPNESIPMVVRPKLNGLNLMEWARNNSRYVEDLLWEHRALLFRGFDSGGIEGFQGFVEAASEGERLEYKDRSTPRSSYGHRIYNATVYPQDQSIRLHNEGSYWTAWPKKIFFSAVTPAAVGGETPIGDVQNVFEWIDPKIRREFEAKGILYVRNYNNGMGLTWQEVFQTQEHAEVERYCRDNDIEFEWKEGDKLRTRQCRPAIRKHHMTGESLWFNHAAFFHVSALEPAMRDMFLSELGEDDLPYNTYFGDGAEIFPEVIAHILTCYERAKVVFPWEEGDVALYDNMRIAHGRQPFQGERLTLVAMAEIHRDSKDLRQTG